MTTKTGEKLRGRKRDPEVMAKAWETRRRNARRAKRQARASDNPLARKPAAKQANGPRTSTKPAAKPISVTRSIRLSSADRAALNSSALDRPLGQQAQNARFLEEVNKANAAAIGALEAGDANCAVQPPFSADTIEAIMAASRKKDSAEVSRLLAQTVHAGRMEEQRGLLEATQRQRREHLRVTNQSVVCGFIAEVDAAQQAHRGLPKEMVFGINSFTVVKIVDALNAAGYHAKGFRDPVTR